jgi:predicted HAD superfamily Cof-like phosphohydrolase
MTNNEQYEFDFPVEVNPFVMLKEFITTFDASRDPQLWLKLIREETAELKEALASGDREQIIKEAADVDYVIFGFLTVAGEDADAMAEYEVLEELADLLVLQAAVIVGWAALKTAFKRIHESNMSKLGDDGKPIRREDGKIMKGPNYKPPYLKDLI